MSELLAFAAGFVVMEPIAYALHRWVMHGPGMPWHRSHHAPPAGRWERNDLFPLCFAVVGIAAFSGAATGLLPGWAWWTAAGVTAYGTAYLLVHEVVIHGRLPIGVPSTRYLRWLRDAHRAHHVDGGEPFGMLLPLTSRTRRQPRAPGAGLDDVVVRDRARRTRARL